MRNEKKFYHEFIAKQKGIFIPMPILLLDDMNENERFLLSIIYNYTKRNDDGQISGLRVSSAVIGDFLGISPPYVSKCYSKFIQRDLIKINVKYRNDDNSKDILYKTLIVRKENLPDTKSLGISKKGIMIPKKYIYAESINNIQKILISEFESFHKDGKICVSRDDYFAKLIKRSPITINKNINDLRQKKYVKIRHSYEHSSKKIFQRFIYFNPNVTIY